MRKSLIAALVVVVVAGAAAAAVPLIESHAASQIKADLERDGTTKVGTVEVGLFDRRIVFEKLQAKRNGEITVGHWEASGLAWPLEELIKGRTPFAGLTLGDPVQADRVMAWDVHMMDGKAEWSIESLTIRDFRLDRYEAPARGQFGALAARVMGAASIGHLEEKGLRYTELATKVKVTIDDLAIDRFDKGQLGSLSMSGFGFAGRGLGDPGFRMAEFKVGDLDLRRGIKAMADPGWRPGKPLGRIDLGSLSASGFSGEVMTRYGISLARITQQSQPDGKGVRHSHLKIESFVLDPPPRSREGFKVRMVLQAMGLKNLQLESDCSATEDRPKGEISIDRCAITGPDLGEVAFSARLVQADAPFWEAVDEGNTMALLGSKAGLGSAKLVTVDRGLVERSIRAFAATTGQEPASVRADVAQDIRRFQPSGILITEDLSKLLDTVARFVERGGTLTVEAKPSSPIGIDKARYFSRPGPDLMDILGLSATLSP